MDATGSKRGSGAANGNGATEPRKRRRNRFDAAAAPAVSAGEQTPLAPSDDMADLDRMIAAAKANALQKASMAQASTVAAPALPASAASNGAGATAAAAVAAATAAAAAAKRRAMAGTPMAGVAGAVGGTAAGGAVGGAAAAAKAAEVAALAAQIRASIASNSLLAASSGVGARPTAATDSAAAEVEDGDQTNGSARPKKAQDHTLRLDDKGRQVDAEGKLVRQGPVLTLKANRLGSKAHNPYLQHRAVEETDAAQVVDPRVQTGSRDKRAKRAFNFVEEGTYVKQGDNLRFREHRKLLSGRMSGRNRAEQLDAVDDVKSSSLAAYGSGALEGDSEGQTGDTTKATAATAMDQSEGQEAEVAKDAIPPLRGEGGGPEMEWWDEAFLTKETRDDKVAGKLPVESNNTDALYAMLELENAKTFKYVQHPKKAGGEAKQAGTGATETAGAGAAAAAGDGGAGVAMKVYLTKKERKRIRRTTRMEREREKQDKIALGLMPAPEPKMKMSNFMQVLGDQAVVDPSKVEALVMGQVARRKAEHEARNQAAKLTPQERRDKKKRKMLEDTSKELQVAVFRVADMSDPKRRFKVDVNAQQRYLTGGVVMCTDAAHTGMNMVLVEGGPKAVRAYVKLMTRRIRWGEEEFGGGDSDSDSEEEDAKPTLSGSLCELVWQGTVQSRSFNAFRFQECKSPETARRVLEEKGVAHLWDMVVAAAKAATASAAGAGTGLGF